MKGPSDVRAFYAGLSSVTDVVVVPEAANRLQAEYLTHGVVTAKWATDALHVAIATVTRCAAIVSWNFKHIVNYRRIPLYNAVNTLADFGEIAIYSPLEVLENEED